jgi:hypothetical protein
MSTKILMVLALVAVCGMSSAFGAVIYHENFDQVIVDGVYPWAVSQGVNGPNGGVGIYEGPNWGYPIGSSFPDGALYGSYFNEYAAGGCNVIINRLSLGTYQANTTYTLSAYLAVSASAADWKLSLTKGDLVTDGGFYPVLVSAGTDIAAKSNTDTALSSTVWTLVTVTKTIGASDALIGTNIGAQLYASYNLATGGGLQQLFADGITLDATAIPEPVTLVVLGIGSLFLRRRVA